MLRQVKQLPKNKYCLTIVTLFRVLGNTFYDYVKSNTFQITLAYD